MVKKQKEILEESLIVLGDKESTKKIEIKKKSTWKRVLGYTFLAIFCFSIFFIRKIPFDRFSVTILDMLSKQTNMQWYAKSIEISLLFGPKITFTDLFIQIASKKSHHYRRSKNNSLSKILGDQLKIKEFVFRPNIWELLYIPKIKPSTPAGSFSIKSNESNIAGSFLIGKDKTKLDLNIKRLVLEKISSLQKIIRLSGHLDNTEIGIQMPKSRFSSTRGSIKINGNNLKIRAKTLSNFSKNLNEINLGKLEIKTKIQNGLLKIQQFSLGKGKSDIELQLEGDIQLANQLNRSKLNILLKARPKSKLVPIIENPLVKGFLPFRKTPNGSYALKTKGSIESPKFSLDK